MMKPENRINALSASKALTAAYDETDEKAIINMLADLRHFCDQQGKEFARLDRIAYRKYSAEGGAQ